MKHTVGVGEGGGGIWFSFHSAHTAMLCVRLTFGITEGASSHRIYAWATKGRPSKFDLYYEVRLFLFYDFGAFNQSTERSNLQKTRISCLQARAKACRGCKLPFVQISKIILCSSGQISEG